MAPSQMRAHTPRIETITSRNNRWLARFRAALRRGPLDDGSVGLEGFHLVEEALRSQLPVEAILISQSGAHYFDRLASQLDSSTRLLRTSDRLFSAVAATETPQGIAALVHPRIASFDDLVRGLPLVLVLVGLQDPGNVGAILRSAEAFGATGVITSSAGSLGTAHPYSPKALRASAGSALRLLLLPCLSISIALAQLRVAGLRLFAASVSEGTSPATADLRSPAALLIGNEGAGLPPEVERSCDSLIRISLAAGVDSLNAAVAASVLLYEAARQRAASP